MTNGGRRWLGARTRRIRIGEREVITEGLGGRIWTDFYHRAMTASWPVFFAGTTSSFLALNVLFAAAFAVDANSVSNSRGPGLLQLFFFSVETLATVGYGDMHPQSIYGHIVATAEIFTGMTMIAVMTGLIFARFSMPRARFMFARQIVIGKHDGRDTLMIRLANARQNTISGATARLWLLTTEQTLEGRPYRRYRELKLIRNENPTLALSWTMFHVIDAVSALAGANAESLSGMDASLLLTVAGYDDQSTQELRARHSYSHRDMAWGHRYIDIVSLEAGQTRIDFGKLHDIEPDVGEG